MGAGGVAAREAGSGRREAPPRLPLRRHGPRGAPLHVERHLARRDRDEARIHHPHDALHGGCVRPWGGEGGRVHQSHDALCVRHRGRDRESTTAAAAWPNFIFAPLRLPPHRQRLRRCARASASWSAADCAAWAPRSTSSSALARRGHRRCCECLLPAWATLTISSSSPFSDPPPAGLPARCEARRAARRPHRGHLPAPAAGFRCTAGARGPPCTRQGPAGGGGPRKPCACGGGHKRGRRLAHRVCL